MASSHVRIGKVQDALSEIERDAEEAKIFREYYVKEKDKEKAAYWEARFEYAISLSSRMAKDFNLDHKQAVI